MKRLLLIVALVLWSLASAYGQPVGWEGVEKNLGRKGTAQGEIFKIIFPRSDLSVKVGEVSVQPGQALTSWIGFKQVGKKAMMMGDLVLLENEAAPVVAKLVEESISITALHNHL
jgi:hypothetical protein